MPISYQGGEFQWAKEAEARKVARDLEVTVAARMVQAEDVDQIRAPVATQAEEEGENNIKASA